MNHSSCQGSISSFCPVQASRAVELLTQHVLHEELVFMHFIAGLQYLAFACHNQAQQFMLTLSAHSASPGGHTALIMSRRRVEADSPALFVTLKVML
jgi:hypothetical protein